MKGEHTVTVQSKRVKYRLTIRRNITILTGGSGTGKTTLISMIADSRRKELGITLSCDKKCIVLNDRGPFDDSWEESLKRTKDSIVFIDEGSEFINTEKFAHLCKNSDNYYVIATREALPQLPYSILEVYGIRESSKYGGIQSVYNEAYNIYGFKSGTNKFNIDVVVTEDSNSGYEFFKRVCEKIGKECISAHGKSSLKTVVSSIDSNKCVLAVVDGAAFGSEMQPMMKLAMERSLKVYAPESFEWVLLNSGIIKGVQKDILDNPVDYIESSKYFSWERFFTALIVEKTRETVYRYSKRKLNKAFLSDVNINRILRIIGFIELPDRSNYED